MRELMPMTPLCELANITMGQSPDSADVNGEERGLPFLQGSAEFGLRVPAARVYCHLPLRVGRRGSTLISVRAPVGTMNRADRDYCIGRGLAAVIAKASIADDIFLLHAIEENVGYLHRRSQGSTFLAIGSADLRTMPIPCLSLPKQQRVAEILSTVDEVIEHTEANIRKMKQIKAGLMHDLFTRGITSDGNLRPTREIAPDLYKESLVGWIPKEWNAPLLDQVAARGSGHTPSQNYPEYWNGGIKWLSLADSWRLDQLYVTETDKNISAAGLANSSAVMHPRATVVISRDGSRLGKSGILGVDMAVSQHFIAWTCGVGLNNIFLYWTLQYRKREFENVATGSTIPTIGLQFFKRYCIGCPQDILEQERIGQILLSTHNELSALEQRREKLGLLKKGIMHDLLNGQGQVATLTTVQKG
jgi:type I restriction enzyme, S subunit